jgi:hypothetical protein
MRGSNPLIIGTDRTQIDGYGVGDAHVTTYT